MTALKHDDDKVPLHLLPPATLHEIAAVLRHGGRVYGPWNWSQGMEAGRLVSAALGHVWAWWAGEDRDPESGLSHLAHAMCCLMFLDELQHTKPAGWKDDRPLGLVGKPSRSTADGRADP